MITLATVLRPFLVLAVLAATGPWCCCSVIPHEASGHTQSHGCCGNETSPTHAPADQGPCEGGCDVIASTPDGPGFTVIISIQGDSGHSLIAWATADCCPVTITPANTSNLVEPPGFPSPALRSLYAQRCQLLV